MKTLEDLKDKWRSRLSGFLVESAYMVEKFDAERADAALECLFKERGGCHEEEAKEPVQFIAGMSKEARKLADKILINAAGAGEIAQKKDKGKPRYDLIPGDALHEVVKVLSNGADKYADRNWEIGQPWGKVFGAMMRHCWAWWRGEELDKESGLHHMAHAGAEALFLLAYALRKVGTDDRTLEQVAHSPVGQTMKYPGRDVYIKDTYQERYYGRDTEDGVDMLVTPCPDEGSDGVMIGSNFCTDECPFYLGEDSENDMIKCTYEEERKYGYLKGIKPEKPGEIWCDHKGERWITVGHKNDIDIISLSGQRSSKIGIKNGCNGWYKLREEGI